MKKILITGGAGFIGSNFIKYILNKYPTYKIINLDKLTYAGDINNLKDIKNNSNHQLIIGDICDYKLVNSIFKSNIDYIINMAAESHVDRSIDNPNIFIKTNILGTQNLLNLAKKHKVKKYIQISTDEVYGSLGIEGKFTEESNLAPNSPYSASKASGDLLVRSYYKTYGLPINITRCSNNYGKNQLPEKLIPKMIINAFYDKKLPIYGNGLNIRDWIHTYDHCTAIDLVLHKGKNGEIYNIGADDEKSNIEIVTHILKILNKPKTLIKYVDDRLGHDFRYAIDSSKIKNDLNWSPVYNFNQSIKDTIDWYLKDIKKWKTILEEVT